MAGKATTEETKQGAATTTPDPKKGAGKPKGDKPKSDKPKPPTPPKPPKAKATAGDDSKTVSCEHKGKKYKITHGGIVPGFNEGQPMTAGEIATDDAVLAYLVKAGAANLVEVVE